MTSATFIPMTCL